MKVIDPGHEYELLTLDGGFPQRLRFVKRCDPKNPDRFPGNTNAHPGTTLQSVLRACLERIYYLDGQISCAENRQIMHHLQQSVLLLEKRAARRHGREYNHDAVFATTADMCVKCGHTDCKHNVTPIPSND